MKRPIIRLVVVITSTVAIVGASGWFFKPHIAKWIRPTPPVEAKIVEASYFDTFEALKSHRGFLNDIRLIDTDTPYPIQRGNHLSVRSLLGQGEVCGIRLGMSMSDVVRVWGKPTALFGFCRIGPRMYFCSGESHSDGISLFFRRNRLEIIEVSGRRCEELIFDNGMTGEMPLSSIVKLLGQPQKLPSGNLFYTGDLVDQVGRVRLDLCFQTPERIADDTLDVIAVRIVEEVDRGDRPEHTQGSEQVVHPFNLMPTSFQSRP
jgi:hypothetical protein